MKKLVLSLVLSLFVPALALGDIPLPGKKVVSTTLKVQGLKNGKTANGSILVLVVDQVGGRQTITRVQNNVAISRGYKFNQARLFFVSAALLKEVGNNLKKIDFDNNENEDPTSSSSALKAVSPIEMMYDSTEDVPKDLTLAPIEVPYDLWVDENSPVNSRVITYTLK